MNYNPYDLIQVNINNQLVYARPYEFDSEVADQEQMKNDKGNYVKPTKVSTSCPDCGCGLTFNINLSDPPFNILDLSCEECFPSLPPVPDPFINPFESGYLHDYDLDPSVYNLSKPLEDVGTLVSERIKIDDELVKATSAPAKPKKKKKPFTGLKAEPVPTQQTEVSEEELDFKDL